MSIKLQLLLVPSETQEYPRRASLRLSSGFAIPSKSRHPHSRSDFLWYGTSQLYAAGLEHKLLQAVQSDCHGCHLVLSNLRINARPASQTLQPTLKACAIGAVVAVLLSQFQTTNPFPEIFRALHQAQLRYIVIDHLLMKGENDLQETVEVWKQRAHLYRLLGYDTTLKPELAEHKGESPFLKKFYGEE